MKKILFVLSLAAVVNLNVVAEDWLPTFTHNLTESSRHEFGITEFYMRNNDKVTYKAKGTEDTFALVLLDDDFEEVRTITLNNVMFFRDDYYDRPLYRYLVPLANRENDFSRNTLFTQTLFNDDEKLEFIVATVQDGVVTKYEIISEDGTVLKTLPQENKWEYWMGDFSVHVIGSTKYLAIFGDDYDSGSYIYYFYKISNSTTNGSSNVSLEPMPKNFAFPNPVKSNQSLTIQLSSTTTLSSESYVEMVSLNGSAVSRQPAKIFDNQISVSTRGISSGQYIYNVVSEGKIIDSGKILVQ